MGVHQAQRQLGDVLTMAAQDLLLLRARSIIAVDEL